MFVAGSISQQAASRGGQRHAQKPGRPTRFQLPGGGRSRQSSSAVPGRSACSNGWHSVQLARRGHRGGAKYQAGACRWWEANGGAGRCGSGGERRRFHSGRFAAGIALERFAPQPLAVEASQGAADGQVPARYASPHRCRRFLQRGRRGAGMGAQPATRRCARPSFRWPALWHLDRSSREPRSPSPAAVAAAAAHHRRSGRDCSVAAQHPAKLDQGSGRTGVPERCTV